jgi:hypothetical protein
LLPMLIGIVPTKFPLGSKALISLAINEIADQ